MSTISSWKQKLAPTPGQAILTTLGLLFIFYSLWHLSSWALWHATFYGTQLSECKPEGACWAFVTQRWQQFLYGFYPLDASWRVNVSLLIIIMNLFTMFIFAKKRLFCFMTLIISIVAIKILLTGGVLGLLFVPSDLWGGFFLTVILSFAGIIGAFPLALLLALGRQSRLNIVKTICVVFIEGVRGVPLISVLFMASFMLPLFLPEGVNFDKLLRALIGIMLFQAAYLAEVIRGGMNAVGQGQYEASLSLGLNYFQMMRFIIIPQALRTVIPGIVNTFIALFKDTTLVMIIGLLDFLGIVQSAITDPKWIGSALEAYLFCAFVYWVCCFSMSLASKHMETQLKVAR